MKPALAASSVLAGRVKRFCPEASSRKEIINAQKKCRARFECYVLENEHGISASSNGKGASRLARDRQWRYRIIAALRRMVAKPGKFNAHGFCANKRRIYETAHL